MKDGVPVCTPKVVEDVQSGLPIKPNGEEAKSMADFLELT
jgi:hypothetical protein